MDHSAHYKTVKGKRRRRSTRTQDDNEALHKRGRPMKHTSALALPRRLVNIRSQHHREDYQRRMKHTPPESSPLESLPNELIQQIFFFCFETNLPRASPRLADVLSTESTYRSLILFAYFDDDEDSHVETRYFLPAEYRLLALDDKIRLQEGILACQWCTLARIESCMPALCMLKMTQAWHIERSDEIYLRNESYQSLDITADDDLRPIAALPDLKDRDALELHFMAREALKPEHVAATTRGVAARLGAYRSSIVTWSTSLQETGTHKLHKAIGAGQSTLAVRVLPGWLLRGNPWTEDNVRLLQMLRQGIEFLDRDITLHVSVRTIIEGISNAIKQHHITALTTLLELRIAVFEPTHHIIQPDTDSLQPGTRCGIPIELFHLAARQQPRNFEVLWLLIRASVESIPHDDVILTKWALTCRRGKDARIAGWLLRYMDGTTTYRHTIQSPLFVRGAMMRSTIGGESDLPVVLSTFAEELGYRTCTTATSPMIYHELPN